MSLVFNRIFGEQGSANGKWDNPSRLKAYGGKLYVLDDYNYRVQVVDLQGNYVTKWAQSTSGTDIDVVGDHVYVAYPTTGYVYEYSLTGTFINSFRLGEDEIQRICMTPDYFIGTPSQHYIDVYDHALNEIGRYSTDPVVNPTGIAFYNGEIYICGLNNDTAHGVVQVMDPLDGTIKRSFDVDVLYTPQGIEVNEKGVYVCLPSPRLLKMYDHVGTFLDSAHGDGYGDFVCRDVSMYNGEIFALVSYYDLFWVYEEPVLPPVVTAFVIPVTSSSLTVPITTLDGHGNGDGLSVDRDVRRT